MSQQLDRARPPIETPYRFTVEEYHKLGEAGIFHEDDRVELLDGEIIIMSPIGINHIKAVRKLIRIFTRTFSDRCIVDCQDPFITDPYSEPQPDILLLDLSQEEASELPGPGDVLLLVEVADSSLGYDRGRKLKKYAQCGLREVWLVNLVAGVIEVYRDPAADTFRVRLEVPREESIAPLAFPDSPVAASEILP